MIRPVCLVHLVVVFFLYVAASASQREPSLYSIVDNVETLDNKTLESTLSAPSMGKFVQFLNIFCGHCRRFVPTFKKIAIKLHQWRRLLKVYVVDCAQEQNVKICRDFQIRKTPTLRFFPSNFKRSEHAIGINTNLRDYQDILDFLANQVANNTYESVGQPNFEVIGPKDNLATLWEKNDLLHSRIKYIVLVHQPKGSTIGRDLLLETIQWEDVVVRIIETQNLFLNFNLDSRENHSEAFTPPAASRGVKDIGLQMKWDGKIDPLQVKVVILTRNGEPIILKPRKDTLEEYVNVTAQYFLSQGSRVHFLPTTKAPNISFTMDQENEMILSHVLNNKLQIYRADLQQAIHKLLHIEIPKVSVIEGDSLIALRRLIGWLALSKPLGGKGERFFALLHEKVSKQKQLTGAQFDDQVKELEKQLPNIYKGQRYVGCVSSRPFLRGFTCSLWTLFHYMTVQAAKPPHNNQPIGALATIYGVVKHFFGCEDCVNHFLEMAKRRHIDHTYQRDEEIEWLWSAHNEINQRLANDSTEDPKFPKIQFPRKLDCPECYKESRSDNWQTSNVVQFLKRIYDSDNLSNFGYF